MYCELPYDGDLLVVRYEIPLATPHWTAAVTQTTPWLLFPQADSVLPVAPSSVTVDLSSALLVVLSTTHPDTSAGPVRQTTWWTAGQHSNIHHLTKSVGQSVDGAANVAGPVSSAVVALFRPRN